jgi:hypothetical protein
MFGLKESMQKALASYNDTNQIFLSYKKKTLLGNIFFWSGFAAVLSSPLILAFGPREGDDFTISTTTTYVSLGLMGGGLISLIAGSFVLSSGQENIFDAVNLYNRNRIADYKYH